MYQLVIAEKQSVAQSISTVLGANERKDGFFIGGGYIVSYCAGHLLELAAPEAYGEQYSKWRYADLPIVPVKWKHIASKGKTAQLKILKEFMNRLNIEGVINACDAGREGELIFRLVYEYAKCTKPVKRLWISSMEDAAIKAGFDNLKSGTEYDSLYSAAFCRERADWLVGLNATRLFSVLYSVTLNTGRVQSPTLAMLVNREADISAFVKEPFYMPEINCGAFTASGERYNDRQTAEEIRSACNGCNAVVRSVEQHKKTITSPKLYDLTMLQREANRLLGFTAQQTLDYAQSLYEKKLLTYPRTDSRYLTADMSGTVSVMLDWLQSEMTFWKSGGFKPDITKLTDDKKVTDHHAIIPTAGIMTADRAVLPSGERCILNLVTVRLLCAAAPAHRYEAVTVKLDCTGYSFTAKGKTLIEDGWKAIENSFKASLKEKPAEDDVEDETTLPQIIEGQVFYNVTASVKEGATSPPKHFTEDTLLSSMESAGAEDMPDDAERKGLGTPATRAAIIEKLIKTGFVERQKKNLIPTDKGKNLIAILPEVLTSPMLTAEWENKLLKVQRGELSGNDFMNGIIAFTKSLVRENNAPKPEYAALFGVRKAEAPVLGNCPRCGASVRETAMGFFCDTRSCSFRIWKDSKFWTAKKKPPTADMVVALLKYGRVTVCGLHSEKTGKKYDAAVVLDDNSEGYVKFKLDFNSPGKK